MAHWKSKVDVSSVWRKTKDGTLDTTKGQDFKQFISELKTIIENSKQFDEDTDFRILARKVLNSRSNGQFDEKWSELYDYCDMVKIWLATF